MEQLLHEKIKSRWSVVASGSVNGVISVDIRIHVCGNAFAGILPVVPGRSQRHWAEG